MRRFEKWMPVTAIVLAATIVLAIGTMGRKQVTVIDDDRKIVVSTVSSSMNAVFKAADIHLDPADVVTPPVDTKLTDGLEIQIVRADTHTIHVDETTSTVSTTHKSVEEIIHQANIDLSSQDIVYPSRNTMVSGPTNIEIVRVTESIEEETVAIPYSTVIEVSDNLEAGASECIQTGVPGEKAVTYRVVYENGVEIGREQIEETVLTEPVAERYLRGKEQLYVTSRGRPVRYQKVLVMRATAYDLSFESCGKYPDHPEYGITYSGTQARPGVIAVDPRVIKLGSKLYVESMDRMPDYGFAKAEDTGSAIKGNRVDLFIENRSQALRYGVRTVKVYVLEEPVTEDMMVGYSER